MGRIGIWLWAVIFAAVVALGCFRFSPSAVHTDIRALLPTSEKSASAEKILAHSTGASRDVWVLVGSVNLDKASQSVQRLTQSLARSNFTVQTPTQAFDIKALTRSLSPYRQGFLTTEDAAFLTQPSEPHCYAARSRFYTDRLPHRFYRFKTILWEHSNMRWFRARSTRLFNSPGRV